MVMVDIFFMKAATHRMFERESVIEHDNSNEITWDITVEFITTMILETASLNIIANMPLFTLFSHTIGISINHKTYPQLNVT